MFIKFAKEEDLGNFFIRSLCRYCISMTLNLTLEMTRICDSRLPSGQDNSQVDSMASNGEAMSIKLEVPTFGSRISNHHVYENCLHM